MFINYIKAILCIGLLTTLLSCAEQPIFKDVPFLEGLETFLAEQMQPVSNEQDKNAKENITNNKSTPESGDTVTIYQHDSEKTYDVKVEKIFHAASGRLCIYFFEPDKPIGKEPTGLACLSDDYRWIEIPLKTIKGTPE